MVISKRTLITDSFNCPTFFVNNVILSYKACIGRQIAKTVFGGQIAKTVSGKPTYSECIDCKIGKEIAKHFKDYQHTNKKRKESLYWKISGVHKVTKKDLCS